MSTAAALDRFDAAVAELQALNLDSVTDDEVVEIARRLEAAKRRLVPVDHAVVNQLSARSVPFSNGCRTTAVFLSELLRISRGEATGRVKGAETFGSRRTLTGAPVGPRFPLVAAAQADGVLSDRHAAVIAKWVDKLPDELADQAGEFLESTLVEHARHLDPNLLERHARQLVYLLDQDGQYAEEKYRDKQRSFRIQPRPDGSSRVEGELTAECTAHLLAGVDAPTQPRPASESGPGPPTPDQR